MREKESQRRREREGRREKREEEREEERERDKWKRHVKCGKVIGDDNFGKFLIEK